jgi:ACT domain-containing protein
MARKRILDDFQILKIVDLIETTRKSKCSIARKFCISRATLYKYMNEYYGSRKKQKEGQ